MTTFEHKIRGIKPADLKILLGITLAVITTGLTASAAVAREHDDGDDRPDRGWHRYHYQHNDHNRSGDLYDRYGNYRQPEWRGDRRGYRYRPDYRRPYRYAEPVYLPPPVYYEPRQSPGISLFFPLDLRRW